jgi:hypothetical protein
MGSKIPLCFHKTKTLGRRTFPIFPNHETLTLRIMLGWSHLLAYQRVHCMAISAGRRLMPTSSRGLSRQRTAWKLQLSSSTMALASQEHDDVSVALRSTRAHRRSTPNWVNDTATGPRDDDTLTPRWARSPAVPTSPDSPRRVHRGSHHRSLSHVHHSAWSGKSGPEWARVRFGWPLTSFVQATSAVSHPIKINGIDRLGWWEM